MFVKIVFSANDLEKPDIREFIRLVREWELRTPKAEVVGVFFETDPQITSEEAKELFTGIFRESEHVLEVPSTDPSFIRLGQRGVTVNGKLIGTVSELTLSLGAAVMAMPEAIGPVASAFLTDAIAVRLTKGTMGSTLCSRRSSTTVSLWASVPRLRSGPCSSAKLIAFSIAWDTPKQYPSFPAVLTFSKTVPPLFGGRGQADDKGDNLTSLRLYLSHASIFCCPAKAPEGVIPLGVEALDLLKGHWAP